MAGKKVTGAEAQAEPKQSVELTEQQLESAQGGAVRQEQLNNKYPENMKHEVREHVQTTDVTLGS
jgi:hypothetical protein